MAENTNESVVPQPGTDEYNNQMAALADAKVNQQPEETKQEEAPATTKPDEVPEKFWDADKGEVNYKAWAESTRNLEQKLSSISDDKKPSTTDDKPDVTKELPEGATLSQEDFDKYSDEFFETGELSEATYDSLVKAGIPASYVDSYIEGYKAQTALQELNLLNGAGFNNRAEFETAAEWAKVNMPPAELEAYNKAYESAVSRGDSTGIQNALSGLLSSYRGAKGSTSSSLLNGDNSSSSSNSDVFESNQQMIVAMSDPRYKNDPAYRKQIADKISRSNILN